MSGGGHNYNAVEQHLVRSQVWSDELKERLEDDLMAQRFVGWREFSDGTQLHIPSIGTATVRDYADDTPIVYDRFDTGEFIMRDFTYVSSATYITKKARMDSYYAAQLEARFVPEMQLALDKKLESDIFSIYDANQARSDQNLINTKAHRWVANTAAGGCTAAPDLQDFALAKLSLQKAHVVPSGLTCIAPPEVATIIETDPQLTQYLNRDPQWQAVVKEGITTGMQFVFNLYGFDVYTTNYLPTRTDAETIDGVSTPAEYQPMYFMSTRDTELLNVLGAWRQMPEVESEYNKDMQREEYLVTSRYCLQPGYRPENLVTILTDAQVFAGR